MVLNKGWDYWYLKRIHHQYPFGGRLHQQYLPLLDLSVFSDLSLDTELHSDYSRCWILAYVQLSCETLCRLSNFMRILSQFGNKRDSLGHALLSKLQSGTFLLFLWMLQCSPKCSCFFITWIWKHIFWLFLSFIERWLYRKKFTLFLSRYTDLEELISVIQENCLLSCFSAVQWNSPTISSPEDKESWKTRPVHYVCFHCVF